MPKQATSSRKLIFVNRFFFPDESATAQILSDIAEHFAAQGANVHIITSQLDYSDADKRYPASETWRGIKIHRIWTTGFGRAGLIGRAIDYLSFYLFCFFSVLKHARRDSLVIAKTDPPLVSVPVGFAARLKGAIRVNWLQDLFPEVATALGVRAPLKPLLRGLRNRSLKRARLNIAIGARMAERLKKEGTPPATVRVIHNFVDDEALQPDAEGIASLKVAWGFAEQDFIIGYSGNLGRAHDFETLLGAADMLKNEAAIKFLFIGGGHLRARIEAEASSRGLSNLIFKPYQPRAALARSLGLPDLHWVSLQPALEGLIVPSKLYGITATGRPLLMIGDADGEIGRLASKHGFGLCYGIGDSAGVAAAIGELSSDRARLAAMRQAARQFTDAEASKKLAFEAWTAALEELAADVS